MTCSGVSLCPREGGHGTIVYKGVLDKRQVAVKRLLNMYHASADR